MNILLYSLILLIYFKKKYFTYQLYIKIKVMNIDNINENYINVSNTKIVDKNDLIYYKKLLIQLIVEYYFLLQVIDKKNIQVEITKKNFNNFINHITRPEYDNKNFIKFDKKFIVKFNKTYYYEFKNAIRKHDFEYFNDKIFPFEFLILINDYIFDKLITEKNEKKTMKDFAKYHFSELLKLYLNFNYTQLSKIMNDMTALWDSRNYSIVLLLNYLDNINYAKDLNIIDNNLQKIKQHNISKKFKKKIDDIDSIILPYTLYIADNNNIHDKEISAHHIAGHVFSEKKLFEHKKKYLKKNKNYSLEFISIQQSLYIFMYSNLYEARMGVSNKLFDMISETELFRNAYVVYAYAYKKISIKLTKYYGFSIMVNKAITYDKDKKKFYYNNINARIMENNSTQECIDFSYYYYTFLLSKKFKNDYANETPVLKKSTGKITDNNVFTVDDASDAL